MKNREGKGNLVRVKREGIHASERTAPIAAGYSKNAFDDRVAQDNPKSQEEKLRRKVKILGVESFENDRKKPHSLELRKKNR